MQARRKVAQTFNDLPIFSRPRPVAMYHYATAMDIEAIKALVLTGDGAAISNMTHRRVVESSQFAIPAILERCPSGPGPAEGIDEAILREAIELLEFCYKYNQVDFSFRLADKGQWQLFVAKRDPRITFAYADPSAEAAGTAHRARELEILLSGEGLALDLEAPSGLLKELRNRMRGRVTTVGRRAQYMPEKEDYLLIHKLGAELAKAVPVEMDEKVAVDDISFGEMRRYWGALFGLTNFHFAVQQVASNGDFWRWPLDTMVLLGSINEFSDRISLVSGLSSKAAKKVTIWYLYDQSISRGCPILQPLLLLWHDTVCLPMLYVNGNNFERNFFKLVRRHPCLIPFAGAVEETKEPIALTDLEALFPSDKYHTRKRIQIPGRTDADFVAYESSTGVVLVMQHKWLTPPDTSEESGGNDAKLAAGVRQSVTARDAFRANPESLRVALGLSSPDEIRQIEAVTICRGLESTEFAGNTAVPVIAELSFRALLLQARDLRALWADLNSRPDRGRAKTRVKDSVWKMELAGYEFVFPGLEY